jgi:outer membrane lipoprotein SlyB
MKKTMLMLSVLAGFALVAVGCTSQDTVSAPETSQLNTAPAAQEQSTATVQADPSVQNMDGIQSAPALEGQAPQATAQ